MKQYLILLRPYGMLFLGFTPVFGAIANGEVAISHLLPLLFIGVLIHIFTFVQNDYYDVAVDRKSPFVSNRPLVTESITLKSTLIIIAGSFLLSLVLSTIFFFTVSSFVMLLVSFSCMTFYNRYSKRYAGMEYILSLGVFSCGLYGALTSSNDISPLVLVVSTIGLMQWLFSVGISANLKDVESDSKVGIKTTPIVLGVFVKKKRLILPLSFKIYALVIKGLHILIASLPFFLGYTSLYVGTFPIPGICFLGVMIILLSLSLKIISTSVIKRDTRLIYIGLQEGFALLVLSIVLMSILVDAFSALPTLLLVVLFIVWPLFWFRVLFGRRMIPLE